MEVLRNLVNNICGEAGSGFVNNDSNGILNTHLHSLVWDILINGKFNGGNCTFHMKRKPYTESGFLVLVFKGSSDSILTDIEFKKQSTKRKIEIINFLNAAVFSQKPGTSNEIMQKYNEH